MNNQAPLRGADPVDDELEVGFDESFEQSWYRAELVGRAVMVAVVAAALGGLLGRGPWSHHSAQTEDKAMSVDFEPVARHGTPTQVTLSLPVEPGPGLVAVEFPTLLADPMGLQMVLPRPSRQEAGPDTLGMSFAALPGQHRISVRLTLKPDTVGPVRLSARLGQRSLEWTQVVLP